MHCISQNYFHFTEKKSEISTAGKINNNSDIACLDLRAYNSFKTIKDHFRL